MNDFDLVKNGVQWVLNNCTSYQVAKDLGINNRTINRYQNGESPIENMTFGTAEKVYNYYLKERMKMNMESLEQAIKEFNEWERGARIYIDVSDGLFETSVYHNDVQMSETFSTDNFVAVYSKGEREGHIQIGEKRKAYIVKYTRLILDGWEPFQAKDKLLEEEWV